MGFLAILQLLGLIFSIVRGIPDLIKLIKLLRELLKGANDETVAQVGRNLRAAYEQFNIDKDEARLMSTVKANIDVVDKCLFEKRCRR